MARTLLNTFVMRHPGWPELWGRGYALATTALVFCSPGCGTSEGSRGGDTCSGGSNMENVRVTLGTNTASATELTITWDRGTGPGAGLPDTYFEQVTVVGGASKGTATFSPERTLAVTYAGAPEPADGGDSMLRIILQFPDRRTAIECSHPGMADRYYLTVTLTFDSSGALRESTAVESVSLGNI